MSTRISTSPQQEANAERALRQWLNEVNAFAERYARSLFRSKAVLFWTMAFPAGFYLLTITATVPSEALETNEGAIKAGIAVSFGMFGAIMAALNSFCEQLGTDIEHDRYQQYRSLSISPSADLAGRMVSGTLLAILSFLIVIPVAIVTGAEFTLASYGSPLVVALALIAFAVFWMVVAILVAVGVKNERYAAIVTVSLALIAYMLTGYNGTDPSIYHGPDWLLNVMPHTLATRLVGVHVVEGTAGLTPPTAPGTATGLALLALYAIVSLMVGLLVMRRLLYNGGVNG